MKIKIDKTLLKFELEQLFATKQGLLQFAFVQGLLFAASFRSSDMLFKGVPDYWSNYILIRGFCMSLLLNVIVSMELLIKPKTDKTIEILLSTGLRPDVIAASSVTACVVYNTVSILFYFCAIALWTGKGGLGWVHLVSFFTLVTANLVTLIWTAFFALQTKHGRHLASGFIISSVILTFAVGIYHVSFSGALGTQAAFAASAAALAAVSAGVFGRFNKEKILLS